jgi:hypothetical protein
MLTPSPNSFDAVARAIADPAPEWRAPYLAHFSNFISTEHVSDEEYHQYRDVIDRLHYSADYLIKHLPVHLPGIGTESDAADAIAALIKVRASLDRIVNQPRRGGGPRPYSQRMWCAQVVVEAWRDLYPAVKPKSIGLLSACAEYWQVCREEERDAWNWWRDTQPAVANPDEFVQAILTKYKTRIRL